MKRVIAIALVVVAACAKKEAATTDSAATPPPAPPPAPTPTAAATIVSPAEGDSTGADVTIVLSKEGVTIEKANSTRVEGVGHFHLFLDTPPSADSAPIPPTSKTIVHIGTGDSTFTFKGLAPGQHEVIAVIGYGDHVPMSSRRDTVHFIVKAKP
jgi:hypothetical protein